MIDLLSAERMGANNYDGYIFVIKTPLKLLSPFPVSETSVLPLTKSSLS